MEDKIFRFFIGICLLGMIWNVIAGLLYLIFGVSLPGIGGDEYTR